MKMWRFFPVRFEPLDYMGYPFSTSLTWGEKVLELFGKRHFCLLSQTKNKKDTSWVVLSDESLKISQIFCTKALLYCDLYSLYRKIVHGPGWSKIRVYSYCGDLCGGPASVTKSLHKRALEIHHWSMRVEMRADSVGDHVALFLATKITFEVKSVCGLSGTFLKNERAKPYKAFPPKGST